MNTKFHSVRSGIALRCLPLVLAIGLALALASHAASVVDSKHNLAISGPGNIKALGETEICIFCHTPHQRSGEIPLWNHEMSVQHYTPYSSTTLKATDVGQPTGTSKLCLSCHDGTVALGMVGSRRNPITMSAGGTTLPQGPTRLGTDLSDDHPISFRYDLALASANTELKDPTSLDPRVTLDESGQMQCTSCHDPHNDQFGKFLVRDNAQGALCATCHRPNRWEQSVHKTSTATWNGQGINPWPHTKEQNVAANACESCHAPHNAGTKPRLLNFGTAEQNCLSCHNGNVAGKNLTPEFQKYSVHPIQTTGPLHDEAEDFINPPRHVTCVDCHNPHAAQASPPGVHAPGSLVGVKGVNTFGNVINPIQKEAELCYRCHGDSVARAQATLSRQFTETNKRLQFATANSSFHPIETTGKNPNVPSLIAPWTVSSVMTCGDCHANNQGPGAGGTGPRGPHGSAFSPLLERQLVFTDNQSESPANYALCYKCHSETSILRNDSFAYHKSHVQDDLAACTTCHDPHGVQSQARLINFNTAYATPNSKNELKFTSTGPLSGTCSVKCHDYDHDNTAYSPSAMPLSPSSLRKRGAPRGAEITRPQPRKK